MAAYDEADQDRQAKPALVDDRLFFPPTARPYILVSAILASALGFIDGSVVAIAIPAIRSDLEASFADAQWISNAYALTLSALILVGGAAGDRFGLRLTFIVGIGLFIAASVACAIVPDATYLITARAIQGIGAAIMVPSSLAIIAKAYPKRERGRAIGLWAASSALTTALGPVVGGLVLSWLGDGAWRWIFAVNLPLGAIAIYLLTAKVPSDAGRETRTLDLCAAALATAALGALAYGLTLLGGGTGDLKNVWSAVAWVVAGLLLLGIFLRWEWNRSDAMIDLGLFGSIPFSGANLATFFLYFALSAVLFYLPMLLIAGWRLSEAETGFIFLPLSAAIAILSGPIGHLADRIGPKRPIALGSLVVGAAFAGLALLSGAGIRDFWFGVFPLMVLMGLGMALVVSPLSTAIMTSVEDEDTGAASGINNAVSRIAGLVAVAAMGVVAALRYNAVLGSADAIPGFGQSPASELPVGLEQVRLAAGDAAFAAVAWCTALLCLLAAIVAWLTVPARSIDDDGAVGGENE